MSRPPDVVFESYDANRKSIFQAGRRQTVVIVTRPDRSARVFALMPRQRLIVPGSYRFSYRGRRYDALPDLPPPPEVFEPDFIIVNSSGFILTDDSNFILVG